MDELKELKHAYKEAVEEFSKNWDNLNIDEFANGYLEGYMLGLKNAIAIMED